MPCTPLLPTPSAPPGETRDRLRRALASLALAQACGRTWSLAEAHREAAAAYAAFGAWPSAELMLAQGLRWARLGGGPDVCVDLLCELVECLAGAADEAEREAPGRGRPLRDRARDHVFEAQQLARHVSDARWEVTVLLRLSDVLDRFGDRDDATQLQVRALQLTVGVSPELQRPSAGDAALLRCH
jgi:hypothetical protein